LAVVEIIGEKLATRATWMDALNLQEMPMKLGFLQW
jgi:hypothetical protein